MADKRTIRILVVEDQFSMRRALLAHMAEWGYEAAEGMNGEHGLVRLRQMDIDLVVTDWQMPKMDGVEMVRRMRADALLKHIPVVMVTGNGTTNKEEAFAAGVNAYISKADEEKYDKLKKVIEDLLSGATP